MPKDHTFAEQLAMMRLKKSGNVVSRDEIMARDAAAKQKVFDTATAKTNRPIATENPDAIADEESRRKMSANVRETNQDYRERYLRATTPIVSPGKKK